MGSMMTYGVYEMTDIAPARRDMNRMNGLSLIEMMCVLVIVSTMSLVAFPVYQQAIARGYRQSAVNALHAMALSIESGEYGATAKPLGGRPSGVATVAQHVMARGKPVYEVMVRFENGRSENGIYKMKAVPVLNGPMHADGCGTFTLDSSGNRGNDIGTGKGGVGMASTPKRVAQCWR